MGISDTITLVIAVIGAVLGILNAYRDFSRDRVKLRVVPKVAFNVGANNVITGDRPTSLMNQLLRDGCPARLCIEVINLSTFPITISAAGFGRVSERRHVL